MKPTSENIYYVKSISPTHLRLIHLFTGAERSVPKEYITKLNIADLAAIRFSLENHHLSAVHNRLQKENKYLPPQMEKQWLTLLNDKYDQEQNIEIYQEYKVPYAKPIKSLEKTSVKFNPKVHVREFSGDLVNDSQRKIKGTFRKGNTPRQSLLVYLTHIDFSTREIFKIITPYPNDDIN